MSRELIGRLTVAECQQAAPKPFSSYASAPNDVWSLGVILVNLTCGRNPWKRACYEDSTFRAFMRDPNFLKSILPLTSGLNAILSRIFEVDPSKRCTISELKEMILSCDRLTTLSPVTHCYSPPSPYSPVDCARDAAFGNFCQQEPIHPISQLPSPLISPVANTFLGHVSPRLSQFSNSSGSSHSDTASVFSDASSASSNSSTSSFTHITNVPKVVPPAQHQYVTPNPGAWYTIPSQFHRMANYFQAFQHAPMQQLQVC